VHVETIRYYERLGLIPRPPRGASYRHYPDSTVARVRFIRHAADHGFTLREIGELLELTGLEQATCADVCARIDRKIEEIDVKIAELQALRDHLASRVEQSPRQGPADRCKAMECFYSGHGGPQ
jgi:MerR family mercuric resistance operon transcriptional regulator